MLSPAGSPRLIAVFPGVQKRWHGTVDRIRHAQQRTSPSSTVTRPSAPTVAAHASKICLLSGRLARSSLRSAASSWIRSVEPSAESWNRRRRPAQRLHTCRKGRRASGDECPPRASAESTLFTGSTSGSAVLYSGGCDERLLRGPSSSAIAQAALSAPSRLLAKTGQRSIAMT